jgi:hypothetical protein
MPIKWKKKFRKNKKKKESAFHNWHSVTERGDGKTTVLYRVIETIYLQ